MAVSVPVQCKLSVSESVSQIAIGLRVFAALLQCRFSIAIPDADSDSDTYGDKNGVRLALTKEIQDPHSRIFPPPEATYCDGRSMLIAVPAAGTTATPTTL